MTSIGKIWAIARMTLLEARRRKVFTILLLFATALLSSILFFPSVEMESRLRLIEVWALRASAIFTAIVGLFLAGFSLPQDFEQKRIYMIVTKPVSKSTVFLGRYVGYVLLLALFIGTMGIITVGFLRTVKVFSGDKFPALAAYPRVLSDDFTNRGGDAIEGGGLTQAIKFGPDTALVWTFRDLRRSHFEDSVRAQARLVFGSVADQYRSSGTVRIVVRNPAGASHEIKQLEMNTNEEREFTFPASLIRDDGTVSIEIHCGDSDGVIASAPTYVPIFEKSMLFELAFLRGLGLILLQSMIVLSITLASSTLLSAPISILLGIILYIFGSIYGYILEGTREIDNTLSEIRMGKEKQRTPEDLPVGVLWFSTKVSKVLLKALPNFDHFDYSVWLLKDRAVSWTELGTAGGKALPPILVLVALGTLVMAFKDFDR
jgi:ABC-type transport system involved in multi-copper enzyme maturation permease subunit